MFEFSKSFEVEGRLIGQGAPVYLVAEAGVAHFGRLDKALALVDLAVKAQADAVKFQVFRTTELVSSAGADWIERLKSR
ncbi:MAG: N-acylneuraminate-9-phosphate synthase, partial [Thermodesulfobacteriota bacterium]